MQSIAGWKLDAMEYRSIDWDARRVRAIRMNTMRDSLARRRRKSGSQASSSNSAMSGKTTTTGTGGLPRARGTPSIKLIAAY
jgi:hypothetical protein